MNIEMRFRLVAILALLLLGPAAMHANANVSETVFVEDSRRSGFNMIFIDTLSLNESKSVTIRANEPYNWTGVKLINGLTYKFTVGSPEWNNGIKQTDAEGYEGNIVLPGTGERRYPNYRWMALVGALFTYDDQYSYTGKSFLIAKGRTWKATKTGVLAAFANDCKDCYGDNSRVVTLTIKRIG